MGRNFRNHSSLVDSRESDPRIEGGAMAGSGSEATIGSHPSSFVPRRPPSMGRIAEILAPYCREKGIVRVQVFGSVARGETRPGSDVDLIVTFAPDREPRGLDYFGLPEDMEVLLGVPVDLMTPDTLAEMTNPYRRNSIICDTRELLAL